VSGLTHGLGGVVEAEVLPLIRAPIVRSTMSPATPFSPTNESSWNSRKNA
jgi:hypothetical protein